jgi:hypothetical protein
MLFVPPRHGKSTLASVHYPAYRLECDPRVRVVLGCYNADLATTFSRQVRSLVRRRAKIALNEERQAATDWQTRVGGGLRAVGVGGGVTGHGADLLIIDDPIKNREEADSPTYRDRIWQWFKDDLYTRLEPGGAIVLIMTRWHEDDLAGRLLLSERAEDWEVVSLPALAEADDLLGRAVGPRSAPTATTWRRSPTSAPCWASAALRRFTSSDRTRPRARCSRPRGLRLWAPSPLPRGAAAIGTPPARTLGAVSGRSAC